jgi:hypothetical protein
MPSKKAKFLLTLGVAALTMGGLASCGEVVATPTDDEYYAKLLDNGDGSADIANNELKEIYDALVSEGDTNSSNVLNNILYLYSKSVFGDFWDLKAAVESGDVSAIAAAHDVYKDADGNPSGDKVEMIYRQILYKVKKVFYSYVTNSTYQVRSKFYEKKFYDAQVEANYDLDDSAEGGYKEEPTQVRGETRILETLDASEIDSANATSDASASTSFFKNLFVTYKNYIDINVLPDIYRDMLVDQYLYTENFTTLANSYGRKVEMIRLEANSAYPTAVGDIVLAYSQNIVNADASAWDTATYGDLSDYGLSFLDRLVKGYYDFEGTEAAAAEMIYEAADWTAFTAEEVANIPAIEGISDLTKIRKESTLGGYISDLIHIYDPTYIDDSSLVSDYTSSGSYTVTTGFSIKTRSLIATSNITYGWYTTSNKISNATDDISTRLFKIGVANEVGSDLSSSDGNGRYVWERNGNYYLTPSSYESTNTAPFAISDSGTWYIVRVEEAVKFSKFQDTSDVHYETLEGEYIARCIADEMGSSDTYVNLSNRYWVNKMAIVYHDTSIYDYFKKTFPDLFD